MWSAVGAALTEDKFRIKFHAVLFQQGEKLRLKTHFLVMRLLRSDVLNYGGSVGTTHAESPIALLPGEFVTLLGGPSGGVGFDGEDHFGNGQARRNLDEEVDVVLHAANGVDEDFKVVANACGVRPKAGLKFGGDRLAAIFGAEDDMEQVLRVCVGHVPCLRR